MKRFGTGGKKGGLATEKTRIGPRSLKKLQKCSRRGNTSVGHEENIAAKGCRESETICEGGKEFCALQELGSLRDRRNGNRTIKENQQKKVM